MENRFIQLVQLRKRAEAVLLEEPPENITHLSPEEIQKTIHNLHVHQVELEMQNEELRRIQAELDVSGKRYFDFYNLAPVGYWTISEKGLILEANLTSASFLGLTRSELINQPVTNFVHHQDQDIYYLFSKNLSGLDVPGNCDLRVVRKDGTTLWLQLNAIVAQDDNGAPVSRIVLNDITERKQAETVLHRKQALLARTEKIARVGSWEWDVATDTVKWSDELFHLFQLEPAEVAPSFTEHAKMYHPEDLERLRLAVEAAVNNNIPYEIELRALRKDGTTLVCLARGLVVEEIQGGRATRLVGSLQDITERKQAEEELRANQKRLSDIIKFLPNATLAIDKDGRVIIWNEAIEQMTGIAAAEMLGKGDYAHTIPFYGEARPQLLDLIFADHNEVAACYPRVTRESDGSLSVEVYCKALYNNKGAWVFAKAAPLHDQDGNIIGAIESVRDISERKQTDTYEALAREVLHILNEPGDLRSAIGRVLAALKVRTGFDAVGIRLQEGEDYPYFVQEGFPADFLLKENSLIARTTDGAICREQDGNVKLECTCGLVISGRTDPTNPLFTPGGSCWTNDSKQLLGIPERVDPRLNPRNRCVHYDYASVALIPIRNKERIIGLLQLNDRRKEGFTLRIVELLEGIAAHIGEALMRKHAEEALRHSEARYAETLSVVDTGLWEWHVPSGQAVFSKIYYEILGYEDEGFPATYDAWRQLVHPDDLERVEEALRSCIASGEGFTIDLRMKMKQGPWRWVCTNGKAIEKDQENTAIRMIGTLSDITGRKRAEEETIALQLQLIQAQKMEAIGTLAGGIAHDFNNILGAIIGYTEIAIDDLPQESMTASHLTKVLGASQRASTLVKQILAFSRQANIQRVPLQPSTIVKEAIKLLRPSLPSTITIQQQIDTSIRPILADPTQVHQILMNLCTNAFHAMEQDGGTLTITLKDHTLSQEDIEHRPELKPGPFVVLTIRDTGQGIPPEVREKIFEPYFTTKEVGKGTGMGLAITHGIITGYGGFITCESEPDKGTVFDIYFPAIEEKTVAAVKPVAVAPPGTGHILLIDDEKMLVELGKTMLERLGYLVTAMTSSTEALNIFQNQPYLFDAIITDQTMPDMTGLELSRQILQIRPEIPIILCTGYSTLVDEKRAKTEGIKGFLDKPITKKGIASLLRKVLDESKVEG